MMSQSGTQPLPMSESKHDEYSEYSGAPASLSQKDDYKSQQHSIKMQVKHSAAGPLTTQVMPRMDLNERAHQTGLLPGALLPPQLQKEGFIEAKIIDLAAVQEPGVGQAQGMEMESKKDANTLPMVDDDVTLVSAADVPSVLGEDLAKSMHSSGLDAHIADLSQQINSKLQPTATKAKQMFTESVLPQLLRVSQAYNASVQPTVDSIKSKISGIQVPKKQDMSSSSSSSSENIAASPIDHEREAMLDGSSQWTVQAKNLYENTIKPRVDSLYGAIKASMAPKEGQSQQPRQSGSKPTMQDRLMLLKNKALQVWAGEEPYVTEKAQMLATEVEKRGLEVPLIFLASLLVLWLSISVVSLFAFPATTAVNHIGAEPYVQPHPHHLDSAIHLPGGIRITDHLPVHEASQNVPMPGFGDRSRVKYNDANERIMETIHDLQDRANAKLSSIQMPSAADGIASLSAKINGVLPDESGAPSHAHTMPDSNLRTDQSPALGDASTLGVHMTSGSSVESGMQGLKDGIHILAEDAQQLKMKIQDRAMHVVDDTKLAAEKLIEKVTPSATPVAHSAPMESADMGTGPSKLQDRLHHLMP